MRVTRYGITKDYILALRAVLSNGQIIRAGKRIIKDAAGLNTVGILNASENALVFITEITLKPIAKPEFTKTAMLLLLNVCEAMSTVYK